MLVVHLLSLAISPVCDLAGQVRHLTCFLMGARGVGTNGVALRSGVLFVRGVDGEVQGRLYHTHSVDNIHSHVYVHLSSRVCVYRIREQVWIYSSLPCIGKPPMVVVTVQGAPQIH